jgi:hypothetical protein
MTLSVLKSVLVGLGGSLILTFFFSTFLAIEKILSLMPIILGFNGLVLGYGLVESLRARISNYGVFSFVMGLGEGAAVFVAVKLIEKFMKIGFSPTGYDLVVYILVSGITSILGARLAVRYFNL